MDNLPTLLDSFCSLLRRIASAKLGLEPIAGDCNLRVGDLLPSEAAESYRVQSVQPLGIAELYAVKASSAGVCTSGAPLEAAFIIMEITGGLGLFAGQRTRLVFQAPSAQRALRSLRPLTKILRKVAAQKRVDLAKRLLMSANPTEMLATFGYRPLKVVSVFSGISALSAATTKDKIILSAVFEIAPDACCVLSERVGASAPLYMPDPNACDISDEERAARRSAIDAVKHLPSPWSTDVINLGDITQITDNDLRRLGLIDIIEGSPPCQAYSSAGGRQGLNDPRGRLTQVWVELVARMRRINHVQYAAFENVPGILGNKTNPWGDLLGQVAGIGCEIREVENAIRWDGAGHLDATQSDAGCSLTWRRLDAQYFGVAQRRLRVFAVASFGNGARDRAVLHEGKGDRRCGDPDQKRKGHEEAAADLVPRVLATALPGPGRLESEGASQDRGCDPCGGSCLGGASGPLPGRGAGTGPSAAGDGANRSSSGLTLLVHRLSRQLRESIENGLSCVGIVDRTQIATDIMPTLTARTEGGGSMLAAVHPARFGLVHPDVFPPLMGSAAGLNRASGLSTEAESVVVHTTSFKPGASKEAATNGAAEEIAPTLLSGNGGNSVPAAVVALLHRWGLSWVIRRLMPTEAEVLQGFPKGWTDCFNGKKSMSDTVRYKLVGNSIAVPVYWWIFERLWRVHVLSEFMAMETIPEELLTLRLKPFTGKDISIETREAYWRARASE